MAATLTCCRCGYELTRPDIKSVESPFPDLLNLGSNVVLPSCQTNVIASSISSALRDVSQLDQEILRLANVAIELRRKRDEMQSFAMKHKSLVSPIRRVPPEIITEIFLYCADGYFEVGNPILLASVCSRWRSIALSSPQIWASYHSIIHPENLESQTAIAKIWLSRAGKHPLSISLEAYEGESFPDAEIADTQSLVDVFVARCEQWRNVELTPLPHAIIKGLLGAKDRLDQLEDLTFGGEMDWDAICQDVSAVFATAPKLRFLRFNYLFGTPPQLPWQQLHELSVKGELSAQICLDILKTTPSLEKCTFWMVIPETPDIHAPSSITLPMLRCMTIYFTINAQNIPSFLSALHLPAIQDLSISAGDIRQEWEIPLNFPSVVADAIANVISRGSLLKLALCLQPTRHITPASTFSILRAAPKLTGLSLWNGGPSGISQEFADQFTSNACLVPNLQKLELECFDESGIHLGLDMIEGRGRCLEKQRNPLKQLLLRCYILSPFDSALKSRLLRMTQSGLDIQLFINGATRPFVA